MLLNKAMQRGSKPAGDNAEKEKNEGQDGKPGRFMSSPTDGQPLVQKQGIEEPGHEGPDLLGVPLPIASPGRPRPNRSYQNAQCQQRETAQQAEMVYSIQVS